jgi:predicted PurR-regulated permease PerM
MRGRGDGAGGQIMSTAWRQGLFWLGLIALFILALHLLRGILLPFVAGAALAFFLDPVVDRLERLRLSRTFGTLLVLTGFLLLIGVFLLLLAPLLEAQIAQLVSRIPNYLAAGRAQLDNLFALLEDRLPPEDMQKLRDAAGAKIADIVGGAGQLVSGVLTGGVAVANIVSLIFITPVVSFFLLRDWDLIVAAIDSWLPRRQLHTIREQANLINETLSGFIRGQASVCALLGTYYAIGLTALGLDFGLVLGLMVGLLIFIPFVGGVSGGVIAVALAFAQFGDWHRPLSIAILFVVGQTLEGNVVTPKLVGDRVNLHPVWIIFSLLAFGALFGFLGVLVAVPFAAVIGVLLRFAVRRYLASPLYDPDQGLPTA